MQCYHCKKIITNSIEKEFLLLSGQCLTCDHIESEELVDIDALSKM